MKAVGVTSVTICGRPELRRRVETTLAGMAVTFRKPDEDVTAFLRGKDAALIGREAIDAKLLAACPTVRAVSVYGVGYDNVDEAACRNAGVKLLVAPGVNADAVAEHALGLMLAVLRNISHNDRLLHEGTWNKAGGRTLYGKTVAIVGCGAIGSRVGRLLKAFGCQVVINDVVAKPDLAKEWAACELGLEKSLEIADIVTVHVPLTSVTRGMFDDRTLGAMKRGSVLINTSRGAVVSLEALKRALNSGQIAGAGLDVFEIEPIIDRELFSFPGVVGTPHTAGNAQEAVEAMTDAAASKLREFFKDRVP
jgi:D-3-phosphoglycerate dehydrogenase